MRITKDEARILAYGLCEVKHEIVEGLHYDEKKDALAAINKLQELEDKLDCFSKDRRRSGRRTQNGFYDTIRRYIKSK